MFNRKTLSGNIGASQTASFYTYKTTDTGADTTANDYFLNTNLGHGDMIYVLAADTVYLGFITVVNGVTNSNIKYS